MNSATDPQRSRSGFVYFRHDGQILEHDNDKLDPPGVHFRCEYIRVHLMIKARLGYMIEFMSRILR